VNSESIATELLAAYDAGTRAPLFSTRPEGLTLPQAYEAADVLRRLRIARDERPLGWKIGFTNRSIWDRYRVHAPIWGPVWDSTVAQIDGISHGVSLGRLVQPRLEPEIVFGFARAPTAGMSTEALAECLEWVALGFEIVHTHFDDWRFAAPDTVADFALHGRLFIGPRVPRSRFDDLRGELAALQVALRRNGAEIDRGEGRVVLDGPLDALRSWVDAMHAQTPQWPIAAGDIVTTGTITDAWPLAPGEHWESVLSEPRLPGLTLNIQA
jgi:2-oxo-3-hexenedioate decarboxylase